MTVSTTSGIITYAADGATTNFTFPFPAVDPDFIDVFITNNAGVITQLAPGTFSVTLNPPVDPNPTSIGGSVVYPLVGPPLVLGNQLTIVRNLPRTQSTSISNQSIVYPPVIEQEFDYLTMLDQAVQSNVDLSFRVGAGDPAPLPVPPVAARANKVAFFDNSGNLTAGGTATSAVSAAMAPVVGSATLAAARVAMGVAPNDSPTLTGNPQAPTPPPGDSDTSIATTAFVAAATAGTFFTTGDLKSTHKTVADIGWIMWADGTIGSAGSGSSLRANVDTQALFTLYYNGYSDANCPLLTSVGGATTRGAQGPAATAFSANCRMTLPKGPGRSIGVSGSGSGLTSRTLGSAIGAETVTQTLATLFPHTHPMDGGGNPLVSVGGVTINNFTGGASPLNSDTIASVGGGSPMAIMNPTTYINIMVKL